MKSSVSMLVRLVMPVLVGLVLVSAVEAADRDKLLSEPGVYGTFAAFSLDADWGRQDQPARIAQLTTLKGVVEQYREKLAIDVYLLRGLSDHADVLFRIHAIELRETQQFLLDLQGSLFGKHLTDSTVFSGSTNLGQMARSFADLIGWLGRDNRFPDGVILLTGTGIVPGDDFTLQAGDVVEISIDGIGTLANPVVQGSAADRSPPPR